MQYHWQAINIAVSSFGFTFASTMQFAHLSVILQFMGFPIQFLSLIWLIAPLTGVISQPLIGIISDNLETPYGKRKPIFLVSTLLSTLALISLPFYNSLWFVISMIFFLDIGTNGNNQLQKVLILELLPKKTQIFAFSLSTALSGIGAVLAAITPFLLIQFLAIKNTVTQVNLPPPSLQISFIIGAVIYFLFCLWTFIGTKEKTKNLKKNKLSLSTLLHANNIVKNIPHVFWEISIIQFFTWMGIFIIWSYLNLEIAQNIFYLPIHDSDHLEIDKNYLAKADLWTSLYYGVFQLSSTFFSFLIPWLNRIFDMYRIYCISLIIGGAGLLFIPIIYNPYLVIIPMLLYGIVWGAVLTCPYDIVSTSIPKKNHGLYLGIFNLTVTIPQIIVGLFLGFLLKNIFHGQAIYLIVMAGIFLLAGALTIIFILINKPKLKGKQLSKY